MVIGLLVNPMHDACIKNYLIFDILNVIYSSHDDITADGQQLKLNITNDCEEFLWVDSLQTTTTTFIDV